MLKDKITSTVKTVKTAAKRKVELAQVYTLGAVHAAAVKTANKAEAKFLDIIQN